MMTLQAWFRTFHKYAGGWLLVSLFLLCGATTFAQQTTPDTDAALSEAPAIEPIAAADIPVKAVAVSNLLRRASEELAEDDDAQVINEQYTVASAHFGVLREQTRRRLQRGGPVTILQDTEREWLRVELRIDDWLQKLVSRADAIDSLIAQIEAERSRWEQIQDSSDTDLPTELKKTVQDTVASIATVEDRLRAARNTVLTMQAKIAQQKTETDGTLASLEQEIVERRQAILSIDSPPLWQAFGAEDEAHGLTGQIATTWRNGYSAVPGYLQEIRSTLYWQIGLFALLLTFTIGLSRRASSISEQDTSPQSAAWLLQRPVAAALLLYLPFIMMTDPRAPAFWNSILGAVLIAVIVRLMPQLVRRSKRNWALPIVVLFVAWQVARVTPIASPVHRLMLLIIAVLGVLVCLRAARDVDSGTAGSRKTWPRAIELGGYVAAGLLIASVFANVIGSVGLATFIADGIMYALFGVILILLAVGVLQSLVRVSLQTQSAKRFSAVRSRSDSIWAVFSRSIRWLAVAAWVYIVLTGFLIIDPIVAFIKNALETNVSVGQLALSPEDIFLFVFVIWLSFKLSQFIRFVLETAVLPHMHLPRGAPAAITSLTNYAVIVIGVMVAMSAAGFDMSRVTIIFGALGVGIGFGLQNVVNNFLSGLILLFERPIKVGDVVEINNTLAVVKHIAMRASTVRSYEGAMIIVPNANLISAEVVNWTYGDDKRRIEIPLGVAYGSDPKAVIELIVQAAKDHPAVSETREPEVHFCGFGDSSLDFELRAWVPVSTYRQTASDLRVAMTEVLAEAGITIPFPQRDLHLRGDAELTTLVESTK